MSNGCVEQLMERSMGGCCSQKEMSTIDNKELISMISLIFDDCVSYLALIRL